MITLDAWTRGFPCQPLAEMSDALCAEAGCAAIDVLQGGRGCIQSNKTLMDVSRLVVRLTGGQISGECMVTVRPCRTCDTGSCSCEAVCAVTESATIARLTDPSWAPVHQVSTVWVDGRQLPASAWRVLNRSYIERTDGGVWPTGRNVGELGDPGSWGFVARIGRDAPDDLKRIIAAHACDLAHQCPGGAACGDGGWDEFDAWHARWLGDMSRLVPGYRSVSVQRPNSQGRWFSCG